MIYVLDDITATETYATACPSWLERNKTRINEINIEKKKNLFHMAVVGILPTDMSED